jgi:hypothetical protein
LDTKTLRIFQNQIMRQSQFALMAMDDLKNALSSNDEDRLWYSVQAFLVAAGNISKLLWPKSNPERGQIVRQSLAVPDDSVLRDRSLRNYFKNFDERIDSWAKSSKYRVFTDGNIIVPAKFKWLDPNDYFRNFDPDNIAVSFHERQYKLISLYKEIRRIHAKSMIEIYGLFEE